ncbi:ACT domain protein [Leucothrix sargassi]|nr:ACT domain protein [Leucothrix sargassi]
MNQTLVLTVLSNDRPGIVKELSEVLNEYDGNWTDSRMIHLAGKFAGLLKASVPDENADPFIADLHNLQDDGLEIAVELVTEEEAESEFQTLSLEVVGPDTPGIINAITRKLTQLHVNIQELESKQRPAPMSSELMFYAKLTLGLPEDISPEQVQEALEDMPNQLMVDLNFS